MQTLIQSSRQHFFRRWVLATFGGWILGVLVIVLLAEVGELVGVGDQWGIGIGMGLGVGYFQWRVARKWFGATGQWILASVVGMGTPYILSDIIDALSSRVPLLGGDDYPPLYLSVALGSLLVGLLQRGNLETHSMKANWWVVVCIVGWMLAAVVTTLVMVPRHPETSLEVWRNFGAILLGGAILGLVTGGALVWLLRHSLPRSATTDKR